MKCKICDSLIKIIFNYENDKTYGYCSNCEAIFLKESFIVDNEKERAQYENHNNSFQSKGYVKMFEDFLDYFWEDLDKNTSTALDFGSGPGPVLAQIMKNRALHVELYDKFYQPLPIYETKQYDLITSTEVFEHLQNPLEILKLFKQHLRKDGIVAIMTLFHDKDEKNFSKWWYRRDPTHITFYTPKTFEILAKKCGLKVLKHDNKRVIILKNQS
jgi:SAM-dependent methyltransferase